MITSLAELKRQAKSGNLYGEMIIRSGSTNIPPQLMGKRKIVDSNSVGITFLNNNDKESELRIECASLIDFQNDMLTIYNAGLRDLTPDEQRIFDEWEKKRDLRQEEIDCLTDSNVTYYRQKFFFTDAGYEYLLGLNKVKGKKYDFATKKVFDNTIKGSIQMQYKLYYE